MSSTNKIADVPNKSSMINNTKRGASTGSGMMKRATNFTKGVVAAASSGSSIINRLTGKSTNQRKGGRYKKYTRRANKLKKRN